ncbi:MAG: hypothetical protein WC839_00685 [Candidatus Paceibacterota bacterium]
MNQKNIFILIIGLLVLGTIATVLIRSKGPVVVSTKYDTFVQCIASKNLTMYGAVWCSHCKVQKELFGDSFKYVPYVECTENPNECVAKGVESYPTWIGIDGTKYIGVQSLEKLAEITSCELPI